MAVVMRTGRYEWHVSTVLAAFSVFLCVVPMTITAVPVDYSEAQTGTRKLLNYGNNVDKDWHIHVPSSYPPSTTIKLIFSKFDVEYNGKCSFDNVKLYDASVATQSKLMETLCGIASISSTNVFSNSNGRSMFLNTTAFVSSGPDMFIRFHSDIVSTAGGIIFSWKMLLPTPKFNDVINKQFAATGSTTVIKLVSGLVTNPPDADPITLSITLTDGSAVPALIVLDAAKREIRISPTAGQVGTYFLRLIATNVYNIQATLDFEVVVIAISIPDSTTTITCEFSVLTQGDTSNWKYSTGTAISSSGSVLPTIYCFITPKKNNVTVAAKNTAFSPEVFSGQGSVGSVDSDPRGRPYAAMFWFEFNPSPQGGTSEIWDGVAANKFTVTSYANADSTSTVTCTKAVALPGEKISCQVNARRASAAITTLYSTGSFSGSMIYNPYFSQMPIGASGGVFELSFATVGAGSVYPFNTTLPSVSGVYVISIGSSKFFSVTVVTDADITSNFSCTPRLLVQSATSVCTVLPKAAGVSVFVKSSQLSISVLDSALGSIGSFTSSSGKEIKATFTAFNTTVGIARLELRVNGSVVTQTLQYLNITVAPDTTSILDCGSGHGAVGSTVLCEITAKVAGNTTSVLNTAFSPSVNTAGPSIVAPALRKYRDSSANPLALAADFAASQFEFVVSTGSVSMQVSVSDGISASVLLTITDIPDATSVIKCQPWVNMGSTIQCILETKRAGKIIYVLPDLMSMSISSGSGSVSALQAQAPGDTTKVPATSFQFSFTASSSVSEVATLTLSMSNSDAPMPSVSIVVVDVPDKTSTIKCKQNILTMNAPMRCVIIPKKAGVKVYARNSQFRPSITGTAELSSLSPEADRIFFFKITSLRSFTTHVLSDPLVIDTVTLESRPPGGFMTWSSINTIEFGYDDSTVSGSVSPLAISRTVFKQARLMQSLGRTADATSFRTPSIINSFQDRIIAIACSHRNCIAATVSGDMHTWGEAKEELLARVTSRNEVPGLVGGEIEKVRITKVAVLETTLNSSQLALDDAGVLWRWGTYTTTASYTVPTQWTDAPWGSDIVVDMCTQGTFHIVASSPGPRVWSWGSRDAVYYMGRSGDGTMPGRVRMPPALTGNTIVSMVCGASYGIVVDSANNIYTWGYALENTVLNSGPEPVRWTGTPPWAGGTIAELVGGDSAIIVRTSGGALYQLLLYAPVNYGDRNAFVRVSSDSTSHSITDHVFVQVSVGNSIVLATDAAGGFFYWQPDREDPAYGTQGTAGFVSAVVSTIASRPVLVDNVMKKGMAYDLLYSYHHQFVGYTSPSVSVIASGQLPGTNPPAGYEAATCGSGNRNCTNLQSALQNFKLPATTFVLQQGTHYISDQVVSSQDIRISSRATSSPDLTVVSCLGRRCFNMEPIATGMRFFGLTLRDGVFTTGGCLMVQDGKEVFATNVVFENCTATAKGGVVYVSSSGMFTASGCSFKSSAATDGGAIHGEPLSKIEISSSSFESCSAANGGCLSGSNNAFTIASSNFTQCTATASGGAVVLARGALTCTLCSMSENSANIGGAIHAQDAQFKLTNCTVMLNSAMELGGGIYGEFSVMSVLQSTLTNNSVKLSSVGAPANGGALYCLGQRTLEIANSVFSGNHADGVGGALYAVYCHPKVTSSMFVRNSASLGGAFAINGQSWLTLVSSVVSDNNATQTGGGIMLYESIMSYITGCSIERNRAGSEGGGIAMLSGALTTFSASSMHYNEARSGGGVFFNDQTSPPSLNGLTYSNNTAGHGSDYASIATHVSWSLTLPSSYEPASGELFSHPVAVELRDYYNQVVTVDSSTSISISTTSTLNFVGSTVGALTNGRVMFNNSFGATGVPDTPGSIKADAFIAKIGLTSTSSISFHFRRCFPGEYDTGSVCSLCAAGRFSNESSQTSCRSCQPGYFQASRGATYCEACGPGRAFAATGGTTCTGCSVGNFAAKSGMAECEPCTAGHIAGSKGASSCVGCAAGAIPSSTRDVCEVCGDGTIAATVNSSTCTPCANIMSNSESLASTLCVCKSMFYEVSLTDGRRDCILCPPGADCADRGTTQESVLPMSGWWPAIDSGNREFIACIVPASCLGSSGNGSCAEGMTGNLCSECLEGWGRKGDFECERCPDPETNRLRVIGFGVAITVICVVLTYTTIHGAMKKTSEHSILLKIIMSGLQFNSIAANFNFEWPGVVRSMLDAQKKTSSVGRTILNVDCFLEQGNTISPFYVKSVVFLIVPVFVLILPLAFFIPWGITLRARRRPNWMSILKNYYITTVVVILFLLHPSITEQTLLMFACKKLGSGNSDWFLLSDMRERCWTSEHIMWLMTVAAPMLLLYVVGIPLLGYYLLHRNRKHLHDEVVTKKYSFLFKGYSDSRYYWEMVVVGRKVALVCVAVFFAYSVHIQALMALLLVVVVLTLHIWAKPFESPSMDWMEFFSLLTSFSTFFCGQFLFVKGLSAADRVVLTVVIVGFNVLFVVFACLAWIKLRRRAKMEELMVKEIHPDGKGRSHPEFEVDRDRRGTAPVRAMDNDAHSPSSIDANSRKSHAYSHSRSSKRRNDAIHPPHLPATGGDIEMTNRSSKSPQLFDQRWVTPSVISGMNLPPDSRVTVEGQVYGADGVLLGTIAIDNSASAGSGSASASSSSASSAIADHNVCPDPDPDPDQDQGQGQGQDKGQDQGKMHNPLHPQPGVVSLPGQDSFMERPRMDSVFNV